MTTETNMNEQPEVEICFGPECGERGGYKLAEDLATAGIETSIGDCRNQCPNACLAFVNNKMVVKATVERVQAKIKELQASS
ncbi:MAG: hypothetical protein COB41_01385 [Proteobacteria bacterium]|nr:MAG: hypothetical protein COB41_01385 [Pseudomonadota bacterium]